MRPVLANLGFILQTNGLLMAIPIMIAFYFNESHALDSFFLTAVVSLTAGFLLNALCERKELDFRYSCMLLTIAYFLIGLVGCIPYVYLNIFASPDPVSRFTEGYFESISGFTTTGFSLITDVDVLPRSILLYRSMTQWIGGIGIIFILLAFFYPSEEITQFMKTVGIERIGRSLKTLLALILFVYTLYLIIFAPALYFTSISDPVKAVSLVFSSLTTGGFSPLKDISKLADYQVGLITGILMIAGAVNFRTHYWILNRQFRRAFTKELRLFLAIIIAGAIAIYWLTGLDPYTVLFHTVSASTTTPSATPTSTPPPSGCLVATATYGSELSPEVQFLRGFRDMQILSTFSGREFMKVFNAWYYSFSPGVASFIADNPTVRAAMKILLYPLVGILHLSASAYSAFNFNPELAVCIAGLVASGLIGIVYFSPLALALLAILRRTRRLNLSMRNMAPLVYIWAASVGFLIMSILTLSPVVMMASSAIFVLTTIGLTSLSTALKILQRFP